MRAWSFKLQFVFALGMAGLLLSASGWAEEAPVPSCGRGIGQYLKDRLTFKNTRARANEVITFQKQYWKEVKESKGSRLITTGKNSLPVRYSSELVGLCKNAPDFPGCIKSVMKRVVVKRRENSDHIPWKSLLYSPSDWPAAPLTLPFELLQSRYHLTEPAKILLGIPMFTAATVTIDDTLEKKFDEILKSDVTPGLAYLRELGRLDMLKPGFVARQLGLDTTRAITYYTHEHVENMELWRMSHGHAGYLARLGQMKSLGLLRTRAELAKISRIAFEVYQDEKRKSGASLASRFEKAWQERLKKDPEFSQYSPEVRHLLGMLFNAPFEVSGHSDVELLARSYGLKLKGVKQPDPLIALRPLSHELSDASLVRLAWETLSHPEASQIKKDQWAEKFPKEDPLFLHRVDLFSIQAWGKVDFDQEGSSEHLSVMKDELSYWELAWKDERFADIKTAYTQGKVGQLEALKSIRQRIQAYNDLYADSRSSTPPDEAKLCAWAAGSSKEPSSILFKGPVSDYMKEIQVNRNLSSNEQEGCKIDITEFMYNSYIQALVKRQGAQLLVPPERSAGSIHAVLAACPLRPIPRSCR
ncbi:MAG: hypothetical protein ACJ763_07030 [Bdellovibrionia bacterium]